MKLKLREIQESDIPQVNVWRNDKELIDYLGTNYKYTTEEVDQLWFKNYINNRSKSVRLAIIDENQEKHIGNVYFTEIHDINRSAEFSIFIGEKEYWSMSVGKDITKKMVDHGFDDLNLNRIYLYVLGNNERAINLYRKLQFKEEGILRNAIYKNGKFEDFILMAILKDEYKQEINSKHEVDLQK